MGGYKRANLPACQELARTRPWIHDGTYSGFTIYMRNSHCLGRVAPSAITQECYAKTHTEREWTASNSSPAPWFSRRQALTPPLKGCQLWVSAFSPPGLSM